MSIIRKVYLRLFIYIILIVYAHCYTLSQTKENSENEISIDKFIQSDSSLNYRLPRSSLPLSYDLLISTDIHRGDFKFTGYEKVQIKIIEESQTITLHSRGIIIDMINLYNENGILNASNLQFEQYADTDFLTIMLPTLYIAESEIMLEITFNGTMTNEMSGFYQTFYMNENLQNVWMASTHFLPTNARKAFVCYDEPQIRAPIRLAIQHDESYHAISNMPVSERTLINGTNYVITTFRETQPIQTYLLSFVVSNLEFIDNKRDDDLEQRIYGEPLKINNETTDFANEVVSDILGQLKEMFTSVDIGIPKIDHVQIPQMSGAIEHYGLVAYEENFLLLDSHFDEAVKEYFKPQIIGTLTHGLIHQYFGGIFSPDWWQYLWLSEGFATFYQYYIPSLLYPEYNYMEKFRNEVLEFAFQIDIETEAMDAYVESPSEIHNKFNSIVFQKSAAVIRMFYEALSPSTFTKGIIIFLNEMRFKSANSADLYRALQKALDAENPSGNVNISVAMSSWETQFGYPVVSIEKIGRNLILTQKRFSPNGITNGDSIYSIPITFATKTNPEFNETTVDLWLTAKTLEINEISNTSDEWIIFNIQQVGYYRVDYSRQLWDAIIDEYKRNFKIIHHTNRKVLHEEMFIAWRLLKTKTSSDCLKFLTVLEYETSGSVWESASQYIDIINDFLMFSDIYDYFKYSMHKVLQPHMIALRDSKVEAEGDTLRDEVRKWSRITQHPIYLEEEYEKLLQYMLDDTKSRPEFCSAMRYANSSIYRHFVDKVVHFEISIDLELVFGLGCSMDYRQLSTLFDQLLLPANNVASFITTNILFSTIESSVIGLEFIMNLINKSWWELSQLSPNFLPDLISYMHSFINSQYHLQEFNAVIDKLILNMVVSPDYVAPLIANIKAKLQHDEWKNFREWFGVDEKQTETSDKDNEPTSTSLQSASTSESESTTLDAVTLFTSIRMIAICISLSFLLKRICA